MSPAILFVDDESIVGAFANKVLTAGGHTVSLAASGREALAMIESVAPDIVITDLVMPDIEGLELIRTLVKRFPGLKIIAISGAFQGDFLKVAEVFGVKASLRKPFTATELLAAVNRVAHTRP